MAIFASGFVCSYVTWRQWHSPQPSWLYVAAMNHLNVLSLFGTLMKTRFVKPFGKHLRRRTWVAAINHLNVKFAFWDPFDIQIWKAFWTNTGSEDKIQQFWKTFCTNTGSEDKIQQFAKSDKETGWRSNIITKWRRNWLVVKHFHDHICIPLCTQTSSPNQLLKHFWKQVAHMGEPFGNYLPE